MPEHHTPLFRPATGSRGTRGGPWSSPHGQLCTLSLVLSWPPRPPRWVPQTLQEGRGPVCLSVSLAPTLLYAAEQE